MNRVPETMASATFPIVGLTPRPAPPFASRPRIFQSGASLRGPGFLFARHIGSPGERLAASADLHVISMLCGCPSRFEYTDANARLVPCIESPGSITIIPAAITCAGSPEVRLLTSAELIHCALEEDFTRGVLDEMERPPCVSPVFRVGLRETSIQRILGLLKEELEAEAPSGRVYVESLAHALATRYLMLGSPAAPRPEPQTSALPPRILNRVREKIEANLHTDVSLESLAEESGYSRAHFLRMFRVATGITPHQYILDVRLRHAQDCLRRKNETLIDIAAFCGFSSQSHMTNVFRKRLGVTPAEFRRGQ